MLERKIEKFFGKEKQTIEIKTLVLVCIFGCSYWRIFLINWTGPKGLDEGRSLSTSPKRRVQSSSVPLHKWFRYPVIHMFVLSFPTNKLDYYSNAN